VTGFRAADMDEAEDPGDISITLLLQEEHGILDGLWNKETALQTRPARRNKVN